MTWEGSLSIGILADAVLVPDVDLLTADLSDASATTSAPPDGLPWPDPVGYGVRWRTAVGGDPPSV